MEEKAKTIVICSSVGGVGRTLLSVNLAVEAANNDMNVTIMDGDLQFGDLSMAFNMNPTNSLKELAEAEDVENVQYYLTRHTSGVNLLAAPKRPEYADIITPTFMKETVMTLKEMSELVLIETSSGINEKNLELMEIADELFVVTTPSMSALKNTKLMIETLDMLGLKERVTLIVNKSSMSSVVKLDEISSLTGIERIFLLPYGDEPIYQSLDLGTPYITQYPKSAWSKQLKKLAHNFIEPKEMNKKSSLLQYLSKINTRGWEGEKG